MKTPLILRYLLVLLLFNSQFAFAQSGSIPISDEVIVQGGKKFFVHTAEKGQTLYSISRAYKLKVSDIEHFNPDLEESFSPGIEILIPYIVGRNATETDRKVANFFDFIEVEKGNTLYSIAHENNIGIEELTDWNPWILQHFSPGDMIRIPKKNADKNKIRKILAEQVTTPGENNETNVQFTEIKVEKGQTLYSISKQYHISLNRIMKFNPGVKDGLSIGEIIRIPQIVKAESITDLSDSTKQSDISTETLKFGEHVVKAGETVYGISKSYGISQEEFLKYNPFALNELKVGSKLKIPYTGTSQLQQTEVGKEPEIVTSSITIKDTVVYEDRKYYYHVVEKGESFYAISKFYNIKLRKLQKANPKVDPTELKEGITITIPKKEIRDIPVVAKRVKAKHAARIVVQTDTIYSANRSIPCDTFNYLPGDTFKVALLLPFYLFENDTLNLRDTSLLDESKNNNLPQDQETELSFYPRSKPFLDFYRGVLLGLDSMKNRGMTIDLKVFDTEKNIDTVQAILDSGLVSDRNLIIGPVYNSTIRLVSEYCKQNRIWLVSPLRSSSASFTKSNPYFFQIIPDLETQIKKFSSLLGNYFEKNIVVLHYGTLKELDVVAYYDKYLLPVLKQNAGDTIVNYHVYQLDPEKAFEIIKPTKTKNSSKEVIHFHLKDYLSDSIPNLVILPTRDQGLLSNTIRQLSTIFNERTTHYDISVAAFPDVQSFDNLDIEYLHDLELHTFTTSYTDYNDVFLNHFLKQFRERYHAEPGIFSFQGFDIAFCFLSQYFEYGPGFTDCFIEHQNSVSLTQNEFQFVKQSDTAGYMNSRVFILMFDQDYDVLELDKLFNVQPQVIHSENNRHQAAPFNLTKDPEAKSKLEKESGDRLRLYHRPK